MSRIDPSVFRNWNDGDIMHESDYEQERQILYTAINDNYDRILQKYDKTEVDALLNAMKGADWTNAITIKGNYDLIQSIINNYATDAEVDAIRATLQSQVTQNTNDIANRYTKEETDAKDANLQSQITFLLANKTDKTGDHQGTWQGLTPSKLGAGDMNASRLDYLENVRIPAIEGQLDKNDKYPVTLLPGLNVVTVPRSTSFNVLNLKGRTLINLLGRDGNCEDTTKFTYSGGTAALDNTRLTNGSGSIKVTKNSAATEVYPKTDKFIYPAAGDCYIIIADGRLENAATTFRITISVSGVNASAKTVSSISSGYAISTIGKFVPLINAVQIISVTTPGTSYFYPCVFHSGTSGHNFNVDGFRVYKITQAEYDALGTNVDLATAQAIAAKYPYVDDFKPVKGPYLIRYGKNLLPPLTEWENTHATETTIVSAYKAAMNATGDQRYIRKYISVVPNQTYTFSVQHNGKIGVSFQDVLGNSLGGTGYQTGQTVTFTTPANCASIFVQLTNYGIGAGTFTFENPMLNIGSTALPFESQNNDAIFYDVTLHSSVDGTVYDSLFYRDGQARKLKRFEEVDVNGDITNPEFNIDATGYKVIRFTYNQDTVNNQLARTLVKYDGKILKNNGNDTITAADQFLLRPWESNKFYISIADTDSGWTEAWAGTTLAKATYTTLTRDATAVDMIKAYFNGWKWDEANKRWFPINNPASYSSDVDYVTNPSNAGAYPYRLLYQLATPVEVPVTAEGEISLHEGDNLLEVGTGVVRREPVIPQNDAGYYYIAGDSTKISGLNGEPQQVVYRTEKILSVYKNDILDKTWTIDSNTQYTYGLSRAYKPVKEYDPSAAYSVTYTVLDRYLYTAPLIDIQGEYRTKLAGVVAELAQDQADLATRVNVVETVANNAQSTANNALTTANGKAPLVHSHSSLSIVDTRPSGVKAPSAYSMGVHEEFVDGAAYGLPAGNIYAQLRTIKPWLDFSGGPAHQIAFTSAGKIYTRTGNGTGWGAWKSMGSGVTKAYRSRVNRSLAGGETTRWETVLNITGAGRLILLRVVRGGSPSPNTQAKVFADGVDILDGLGYTSYDGVEAWYRADDEYKGLFVDSSSRSGKYSYVALVPYVPFTSSLQVQIRYNNDYSSPGTVSVLMMYELFV